MVHAPGVRALTALLVAASLSGKLTAQARARVSGSIETGAAAVEQPLVRSGTAFYLAPGAQLSAHDVTIGGDAVLAAGSPSWQSFLGNGFIRSPAVKGVRLVGSGQLLKTSGLLPTLHGDLGAEWRSTSPAATVLLRGRAGRLRYGGAAWNDMELGASVVRSHGAMLLAVDASFTDARRPAALQSQLGVTPGIAETFAAQTLDLTPRMIWERGRLRADASLALRAVERRVQGTRAGPQLAFTFATSRGISLFVGAAQRLPDVRAGIPSGRSALVGVRMSGARLVGRPAFQRGGGPSLRVINGALVLDAGNSGVGRAALRGDFTDWQPRDCTPRDKRSFNCGTVPPAGTWRVAVRLNDGVWQQPANLAAATDDFGSVDGLLLTGGKP